MDFLLGRNETGKFLEYLYLLLKCHTWPTLQPIVTDPLDLAFNTTGQSKAVTIKRFGEMNHGQYDSHLQNLQRNSGELHGKTGFQI